MIKAQQPAGEETPEEKTGGNARRKKGEKKTGKRREAVVTCDFTFFPEARTAEQLLDDLMKTTPPEMREKRKEIRRSRRRQGEPLPREPVNKQVFANMQGKRHAFDLLFDRVARRDPGQTKPIYGLLDGDPALENTFLAEVKQRGWEDRLEGVCLDIIHVAEYVWEAATALFGEKGNREPWVRKQLFAILEGRVGRVIGALRQIRTKSGSALGKRKQEAIDKAITYFGNHRHMMKYDEYLTKGYPIASGIIEGTCGSLVKDRTDGSGMHWGKKGAQAVLSLRALKKNNDWDAYWRYYMMQENSRLYTTIATN